MVLKGQPMIVGFPHSGMKATTGAGSESGPFVYLGGKIYVRSPAYVSKTVLLTGNQGTIAYSPYGRSFQEYGETDIRKGSSVTSLYGE